MTGYDKFLFDPGINPNKKLPKPRFPTCLSWLLFLTYAAHSLAQQGAPEPTQAAPVVDLSQTTIAESRAARIVRQLALPPAKHVEPSKTRRPSLLARLNTRQELPPADSDNKLSRLPHAEAQQDSNPTTARRAEDTTADANQEATASRSRRSNYVIRKGDTIAGIFKRQGLSAKTLQRVLDTGRRTARALEKIRPGQLLVLERAQPTGQLMRLTLKDKQHVLVSATMPSEQSSSSDSSTTPFAVRSIHHRVRKGETLSSIFKRHGLSAATLQNVLAKNKKKARSLARLRPGQLLRLQINEFDGQLLTLNLERKGAETVSLRLAPPPVAPQPEVSNSPTMAKAMPQTEQPTTPPPSLKGEPSAQVAEIHADADAPASASGGAEEAIDGDEKILTAPSSLQTRKHTIAKGETLASIFKQYGLSPSKVYQVLHSGKAARSLSRIHPGQELELSLDDKGDLQTLVFLKSPIEKLVIQRRTDGYHAELEKKAIERRLASVDGVIHSSLFADGHKAGLTDAQVMELAEIFGWDIDFALELQPGDQFRVVYEEQLVDGKKYRNGPILAAEFVNRGKTYQAFRFEHDGQIGYYDAKGRSKRRAFIRTPIRFARISSRFQPRRWHPILKKWKSHKGVDYAAPRGTPAKVTGDGRVIFRGWKRGYGRVVIVQHSRKYRTVYAHLSKFRSKVKKGSHVRQGQVIGYVGSSGWATGPHLHYEFRVNNVQRNPLTVKLPHALPLPKHQLASFKRQTAPLVRQLASIRAKRMVASSAN